MTNDSNQVNMILSKPNRDPTMLCPWFMERSFAALKACADAGYPVKMFEGYRSPARQDWLYAQGRTRPGKTVTRARAWQSFHQYGVAHDLVFWDGRKWFWPDSDDTLWDKVTDIMEQHGFEHFEFERPHFQMTAGMHHTEAYQVAQKLGMRGVWDLIQTRMNF